MKKALVASSGGDEVSVTRGAEHRPFLVLSQILAVLIDHHVISGFIDPGVAGLSMPYRFPSAGMIV